MPEPGSTTARDALSGAIRRAMKDLMRLSAVADPELRAFRSTLKRLLAESPGALASVLRTPTVGGLLRCLRRRAPELPFEAGVAELLATIHTDLAVLGALPGPVVQRRLPRRVVSLPARRVIEIPAGTERAEFRNGALALLGAGQRVEIELDRSSPDEASFVPITDSLSLARVDNNPLAMSEAHPDKARQRPQISASRPSGRVDARRWRLASI